MNRAVSGCAAILLVSLGCSVASPKDEEDLVRPRRGQPLRVGLVVRSQQEKLLDAFPVATAANAATPRGERYAERTVMPDSIQVEHLRKKLVDLDTFSDLVLLPLDTSGTPTRDALGARLDQDFWDQAQKQQLDAVLVVEGVRDGGLAWQDEESIFSLDTVLWWLVWPFGVLIPDRTYTAQAGIEAQLYLLASRKPTVTAASVSAHEMRPWSRASTPVLGFILPPAWLADDPKAVAADASTWARETLPIALARSLKETNLAELAKLETRFALNADELVVTVETNSSSLKGAVVSLPRGPLAGDPPPPKELEFTAEPIGQRERETFYRHTAKTPAAALRREQPLLRMALALEDSRTVSMTYAWNALPGNVASPVR